MQDPNNSLVREHIQEASETTGWRAEATPNKETIPHLTAELWAEAEALAWNEGVQPYSGVVFKPLLSPP